MKNRPPLHPRRNRPAARPGAILIIVMLASVLLASLLFYVLNMGQQNNARVVTQHSADAAVAAGSAWVSRTLNTVAMDNVGMAQTIDAINYLDSLPLATDFTMRDMGPLQQVLQEVLSQPIAGPQNASWVRNPLNTLSSEITAEVNLLTPMNQFWNQSGYDVSVMTFYQSPNGPGQMWRAIQAMDDYSQAAMENLGVLAQLNAIKGGEVNQGSSPVAAALMAPVVPNVPSIRGTFDDFQRPIKDGLLPLGVDDKTNNRGPYDTIFGWRQLLGGGPTGYTVVDQVISSGVQGGQPPINLAPGATDQTQSHFVQTGYSDPTAYRVYGTHLWLAGFSGASVPHSRYNTWVDSMADIKLNYLWPGYLSPPPNQPTQLFAKGYRHATDTTPAWTIPVIKDYKYWFDGPGMLRDVYPSNYFYLEDGVNTSSDDLVLRFDDLGNGQTQVTYISQHTHNWRYDILDQNGNIVLGGLGQGPNGKLTNVYSTLIPTPPWQLRQPVWITDYNQAEAYVQSIANGNPNAAPVAETQFITVAIKSRVPMSDGAFLSPGSWAYVTYDIAPQKGASISRSQGWVDPHQWEANPQVTKSGPQIWRAQWTYTVQSDSDIGIQTQHVKDENGNDTSAVAQQTVYRIDDFVFAGINVGPLVTIRNPHAGATHATLPAPIDLDHTQVTPSTSSRQQFLSFLGIARHNDTAILWPAKFAGGKGYPNQVAIAQSQVFNNHSWDLWTQMWASQLALTTADNYSYWVTQLDAGAADAQSVPALNPQELADLTTYLHNVQPLSSIMLNH